VPRLPDDVAAAGVELDSPVGRFNKRPAVAIGGGARGEDHLSAGVFLRHEVGDWILEADPALGAAEAREGSAGRGAETWVPVVQWLGQSITNGIVDLVVATAFVRILHRLRAWRDERRSQDRRSSIEVSRGGAALVAAAHVSEHFEENGTIVIEAVEEPTSITGRHVTELSYVGFEPWLVLLRNDTRRFRYVVVVMPDGTVAGALSVPFLPHEDVFLAPAEFG
jgi:hypothetical protein